MYKIYNICLSNNIVFEVPAESEKEALRKALYPTNVVDIRVMPITQDILWDETEVNFTHALGDITYIVKHIFDTDSEYYIVELGQATERQDEVDDLTLLDIRVELEKPFGFGYASMKEALKDIKKAVNKTFELYELGVKH